MRKLLLIVDDVFTNRILLKRILGEDYEYAEAENGREALKLLKKHGERISAVLLDLSMPLLDGFGVLAQMRNSGDLARVPVIVMTGTNEAEAETRALMAGASDYIVKPYVPIIIRQRVRNVINLRETAATVNSLKRDRLTGLCNREAFFDKLPALLETRPAGGFIVAGFDIDNFKVINDQYGAEEGDRVLKRLAAFLEEDMAREGGICCRMTADEFAVAYPFEIADNGDCFIAKAQEMLARSTRVSVTFSVGRYVVTDLSLSPSAIYDRAFIAKQSVKGRYDKHVAYYDESMRDSIVKEQRIVNEMGAALASGQFEAWLQPQYNHASGALIGAEALARWRHPTEGLVPPESFVPVFEKNGFVYQLDQFIWETVCQTLRRWMDEGRNPLPISVNVSRYDVFQPDFFSVITGLVRRYGLSPALMRLEITESAFAKSTEQIIVMVKRLIAFGFTVEIDDFGSGYSSLNTLKNVPAQVLKLDMRFLEGDDDEGRGGNIIESVVRMAKWLGMSVIAEGVETVKQADYLNSIGCGYVQGYLYARPMPIAQYEALARQIGKEERLLKLETVENLDNNAFWSPKSMDTLIFNSYVGGACIFELYNGKIELLRVNDKYCQIIGSAGLKAEDALKINWSEHMDAQTRERLVNDLQRSVDTKEEVVGEYLFLDLPGCPRETHLRSTMRVIASAGARHLVYCTNENITAEKRAQQSLTAMMNDMPGGFVRMRVRDDGAVVPFFFNEGFCKLVQMDCGALMELYGNDAMAGVHPDDRDAVQGAVKRLLERGEAVSEEYRLVRGDGSYVWVVFSGRATKNDSGAVFLNVYYINASDSLGGGEERSFLSQLPQAMAPLLSASEDMIFVKDKRQRYVCVSRLTAQKIGLNDPKEAVGKTDFQLLDDALAKKLFANHQRVLATGEPSLDGVEKASDEQGARYFNLCTYPILDAAGGVAGLLGVGRDVTEQLERETVYRKWKQSLKERPPASYTLFRCNLNRNESFDSAEGSLLRARFPGDDTATFDERTARYAKQYVFAEDRPAYMAALRAEKLITDYYAHRRVQIMDFRETTVGGGTRWLRLTTELVKYPNSSDILAYLLFEDIDKRKREELQTRLLAETDPLTGLLNHKSFAEKTEQKIKERKPHTIDALMMFDLDGFKQVNDSFGHDVGDQTLIDVAHSLRSVMRTDDLLGRLGGDEFVVYVHGLPNVDAVTRKAAQICAAVKRTFNDHVQTSASLGVALCPQDGERFETLYKKADLALYHVKNNGKDSYAMYYGERRD